MVATAADFMAEALQQAGVNRVYGVVGDSLNGFTDALRRLDTIHWIHMRHEEAAAFAAGAEAQVTGELAVCAGSCGPGNLHLINGLFDCHRSRVPVLAIAAHIPSSEIGLDYFQATHPESLFRECSHYVELVSSAEQLPQILGARCARRSRGAASRWWCIPGDVALEPLARSGRRPGWRRAEPLVRPTEPELRPAGGIPGRGLAGDAAVRRRLRRGACGGGGAGRQLKAPIVHALRGKEHVEYDNPYDVGMTGLIGFASGYAAMKECDTLLMLGTDFPYRQFYPERREDSADRPAAGGAGQSLPAALGLSATSGDAGGAAAAAGRRRRDSRLPRRSRRALSAVAPGAGRAGRERPGRQDHPSAISNQGWSASWRPRTRSSPATSARRRSGRRAICKMNGKRRLLGSFNHGSMANAMLQAIGAQAAFPGRQVVSLSGDGGFTMMMGDFITLTQQGLPVKVVVLNNGTLGFVELEMKASGFLDIGCELKNPDFAAMARGDRRQGLPGGGAGGAAGGAAEASRHDGPALVDVVSARQELVLPPKTTLARPASSGCS